MKKFISGFSGRVLAIIDTFPLKLYLSLIVTYGILAGIVYGGSAVVVMGIITSVVIFWLVTTWLFHYFSTMTGGYGNYRHFLKAAAVFLAVPLGCLITSWLTTNKTLWTALGLIFLLLLYFRIIRVLYTLSRTRTATAMLVTFCVLAVSARLLLLLWHYRALLQV